LLLRHAPLSPRPHATTFSHRLAAEREQPVTGISTAASPATPGGHTRPSRVRREPTGWVSPFLIQATTPVRITTPHFRKHSGRRLGNDILGCPPPQPRQTRRHVLRRNSRDVRQWHPQVARLRQAQDDDISSMAWRCIVAGMQTSPHPDMRAFTTLRTQS
jgi:hypothetical protein